MIYAPVAFLGGSALALWAAAVIFDQCADWDRGDVCFLLTILGWLCIGAALVAALFYV